MKRYIKADGIKTDIFKKATQQAAINDICKHLRKLCEAMETLDNDKFDELQLSELYKLAVDKLQDVYPYAKL